MPRALSMLSFVLRGLSSPRALAVVGSLLLTIVSSCDGKQPARAKAKDPDDCDTVQACFEVAARKPDLFEWTMRERLLPLSESALLRGLRFKHASPLVQSSVRRSVVTALERKAQLLELDSDTIVGWLKPVYRATGDVGHLTTAICGRKGAERIYAGLLRSSDEDFATAVGAYLMFPLWEYGTPKDVVRNCGQLGTQWRDQIDRLLWSSYLRNRSDGLFFRQGYAPQDWSTPQAHVARLVSLLTGMDKKEQNKERLDRTQKLITEKIGAGEAVYDSDFFLFQQLGGTIEALAEWTRSENAEIAIRAAVALTYTPRRYDEYLTLLIRAATKGDADRQEEIFGPPGSGRPGLFLDMLNISPEATLLVADLARHSKSAAVRERMRFILSDKAVSAAQVQLLLWARDRDGAAAAEGLWTIVGRPENICWAFRPVVERALQLGPEDTGRIELEPFTNALNYIVTLGTGETFFPHPRAGTFTSAFGVQATERRCWESKLFCGELPQAQSSPARTIADELLGTDVEASAPSPTPQRSPDHLSDAQWVALQQQGYDKLRRWYASVGGDLHLKYWCRELR